MHTVQTVRVVPDPVEIQAEQGAALEELIGASSPMRELRRMIERVATSARPALVLGPTGTGKELVVRALHRLRQCTREPLINVNCGAIPAPLVESLLFGHARGAFTGADRDQPGYFSAVREGTLFLDEIGELPLELQARLLRVLETRRFYALGSTEERSFRGHIVAATHADLEARVERGLFREDLFFRLEVLVLRVPSLVERREDIPVLVAHFLRNADRPIELTPEALEILVHFDWPGNVRQLRNLIDRISVFAQSERIGADELRRLIAGSGAGIRTAPSIDELTDSFLRSSSPNKLELMEGKLIAEALRIAGGNKSEAARMLGVHRKVVERRMRACRAPLS